MPIANMQPVKHSFYKPILGLASLAIGLLLWVFYRGGELALSLEHAPLAWLQSMLLVACAVTTFHISLLRPNARLWPMLALAFLFCAIDEKFMLHEAAQVWLVSSYLNPSQQVAFWVHAIILVYAFGGLLGLFWLRKHVLKRTFALFCLGVFVGCCAMALDIAFDNVHIQAYEEVLEYLAELCCLTALNHELQQAIYLAGQSPNSPA